MSLGKARAALSLSHAKTRPAHTARARRGQGLGKNEDGISRSIKVTKREDNVGLGMETVTAQVGAGMLKGSAKASFDSDDNQWWHMGLENALAKRKKTKKKKKQQQNEGSDEDAAASSAGAPPLIMDELFRATGGARLGMRARCSQPGKLLRAEAASPSADVAEATADGTEKAASKKKRKAEPTDSAAAASLEPVGKTRKKDKAKKDKATKKKEDDEPAKAGPATAAAAAAALSDAQSAAQKKARKKARRLAREQRDAAQSSGSRLSSS